MEKIIDEIYSISPHKQEYHNKTNFVVESDSVYGETHKQSIDSIVSIFKKYFNNSTVFYDLGCGLGKIVAHIGLKYSPKKSIGVELSKERLNAAYFIKSEYNLPNNIEYINDSFLNVDISDATVIYCDNTMYNDSLNLEIYEKVPKGCLFICRRKLPTIKGFTTESNESFKTTYFKDKIHYIIKQ